MPDENVNLPDKKRLYCNRCKNETNHVLRGEHSRRFYEEDERGASLYYEDLIFRFWICAGCDEGTLEEAYTMSSMVDNKGNQIYSFTYHPNRTEQQIPLKRFKELPLKLSKLYKETVDAYNDKLYILCTAGLRTLIEGICIDKEIKKGNLEKKIDKLTSILPENIVKNLHSFRFMGNKALHELATPNKNDLSLAIEVCEDLMNFIYELDYKASQLNVKNTRKRNKS
jgi:hypothetical protein